jgi:cytosine/adenosine deaminase-related metal-dependent hydrolase
MPTPTIIRTGRMASVLVKGGTVLSLDRAVGNLAVGDVLIDDGVISEVGPSLRARHAEVVDAAGTIVMPGFVDAHHRLWLSLLRNADTGDITTVPAHGPDDVYAATRAGLAQALAAGVTTVVDWCDVPGGDEHLDAARAAHAEGGVRTTLVPAGPLVAASGNGVSASPDVTASDLDSVAGAWAAARAAGRRIHARAGTAAATGGEVAELGRRRLLGPDVTLSHCTRLSDDDFDAVAASSTGVVLTPCRDMAAGVGRPPMQQLIDRGIRPGLGVGEERLAPGDVLAQMRAAISVQHATLFDLKLAGKGGIPNLLGTRDVIRYATIDGARAVGLGDATGSLTPGKRADLVVLRADRPNIAPVNDPIGAVVWGVDTSNVDWVFVDGVARVEHGELTTDVSNVRQLATAAHRRLVMSEAATG